MKIIEYPHILNRNRLLDEAIDDIWAWYERCIHFFETTEKEEMRTARKCQFSLRHYGARLKR